MNGLSHCLLVLFSFSGFFFKSVWVFCVVQMQVLQVMLLFDRLLEEERVPGHILDHLKSVYSLHLDNAEVTSVQQVVFVCGRFSLFFCIEDTYILTRTHAPTHARTHVNTYVCMYVCTHTLTQVPQRQTATQKYRLRT